MNTIISEPHLDRTQFQWDEKLFAGSAREALVKHPIVEKVDRIEQMLSRRTLDECWFLRPENVAWLSAGSNVVDITSNIGVAAIGYDGSGIRLVAPNNEIDRIVDEELPAFNSADVNVETLEYEWHESSLTAAVTRESAGRPGADVSIEGFESVDASSLRMPLPSTETKRYGSACIETASAVEAVATDLSPEITEREAAARLIETLAHRGFATPVVLVGGSDRGVRHRHFTPKDATLDRFGHLTVVAERGGHNVAVTRTVTFDCPEWLRKRHEAACRIAATAVSATWDVARNEGTAGDVFKTIQDAYATVGYADEWQQHHQGGAIGYESREWTATPGADEPVLSPMPYAWNPTVQGAKCEDTVLVNDDGADVLTTTGEWPVTHYEPVGFDGTIGFHDLMPVS